MIGEGGRGSHETVAVILVLFCLVPCLSCFSLQGLRRTLKEDKVVSEATAIEARTGSILFNGKALDSQSVSASATTNNDLLYSDLAQSNDTDFFTAPGLLEDTVANEAAWRRLNPSLHCGQSKMKFKAMGPGAADLQLVTGDARTLPLIQVPEPCGYSVKQNALGLVLVVPYNGCNVIQENGNFVLPMGWLETPVNLICPMSISSAAHVPSTSNSAKQPWELPLPHGLRGVTRRKRQSTQPMYDPGYLYSSYYNYYLNMMTQTPAPGSTTTAKPNPTTTSTTTDPPQVQPPAYPYNPYYNSYLYYYYYYYYYSLYRYYATATTTTQPTTEKPTTGTTGGMTTTTKMETTTTTETPATTTPTETTTTPTTMTTTTTTTAPPTTMTTAPPTTMTTSPPSTTMTTTPPTTTPTTQMTKPCSTSKPSSGVYPGPFPQFVPFEEKPFDPYVSYSRSGKLPENYQEFMPGYKSAPLARMHPPPHPGFNYWQPVPWFPHSTDQDDPHSNWEKLQPNH